MLYYQIKALLKDQFKVSQISKELGVSRTTVYFYKAMDEATFRHWVKGVGQKVSKLSPYENGLKDRLKRYPDLSAYQLHDWLLEHHPGVKIGRRAMSNYVSYLRERYQIPKPESEKNGRQYSAVEDLPYGQQAQVDFGFYELIDQNGAPQKICFMATVLSRSRQKHLYFLDRPFTTQDVIEAQEAALTFFGGMPKEFVYDQDKLIVVSENRGDILFTEKFTAYIKARKFAFFICRKRDPETKGKVENVVKYVKSNFLKHRAYINIEVLNAESLAWLERTGNGQVHGTTKRIPAQEFLIEKEHLMPLPALRLEWLEYKAHRVHKDNVILWKSNRYSLPVGTYKSAKTKVWVKEQGELLLIFDAKKEELARHKRSTRKGLTISNTSHKRDNTQKIKTLMEEVSALFSDTKAAHEWLSEIQKTRGRYIRDQLLLVKKQAQKHQAEHIDQALAFCRDNAISSAGDFVDVLQSVKNEDSSQIEIPGVEELVLTSVERKCIEAQPQTSNIADYEKIVQTN